MSAGTDGKTYTGSPGFTNATTNLTDYYGSTAGASFYTFTTTTSFTNSWGILAAGGGVGALNGGHSINTSSSAITIKNYGYLLGGGGAGGSVNNVYGLGAAGGGGGAQVYNQEGLAVGGGLVYNSNNGASSGGRNGGGGGGPGGGLGGTINYGGAGGAGGLYNLGIYAGGAGGPENTGLGGGAGGGGYGGGNGGTGGGGGGGGGGDSTAGKGGYSIYNTGTITALYNLQGGSNIYGPLFYGASAATKLPNNYYIRVNSQTNYGQLYCTGWNAITTGSFNNIYIDPESTLTLYTTFPTTTTFKCVLVGNCFAPKTTSSVTLLNNNVYNYSIVASTSPSTVTVGGTPYNSFDLVMTYIPPPAGYGIMAASSLTLSGYLTGTNLPALAYYIDGVNQTSTTTGIVKINKSSNYVSLYANYIIASGLGFTINSDQRIKKNIQHLNSAESLELVNTLKPASFQYVDFLKGTTIPKYGYLAQEVESVFPNLVYQNPAYIPNFFEIVSIEDSRKIVLKEKTTESLDIGTKVQFYDSQNEAVLRQVESIIDSKMFTVSEPFVDGIETLFLYGQEVSDYRSIDTDQINTVLLSALQETNKKVVIQDKKIDELKQIAEDLRKDLDECISKKERI